MSSVDQKNYPETMAAIYLTNAPWIFTTIFKMLQVLPDPPDRRNRSRSDPIYKNLAHPARSLSSHSSPSRPFRFGIVAATFFLQPFIDESTRRKIHILPRTAEGNKVVQAREGTRGP